MTKKNKPLTHDLFGVDECDFCQGTGEVRLDHCHISDLKAKKDTEVTEDCDMCNGTGIDQ